MSSLCRIQSAVNLSIRWKPLHTCMIRPMSTLKFSLMQSRMNLNHPNILKRELMMSPLHRALPMTAGVSLTLRTFATHSSYNSNYRAKAPSPVGASLREALFALAVCVASFVTAAILEKRRRRVRFGFLTTILPILRRFTSGQRVSYVLIALNALVFCLHSVVRWAPQAWSRSLSRFLTRYMAVSSGWAPGYLRPPASLLGHMFSHIEIWHLAFNMIALKSFATALIDYAGMSPEEFSAVFISMGVMGAALVNVLKRFVVERQPFSDQPSLGASGAIVGLLAIMSRAMPDWMLSVFFLPPIAAKHVIWGMVAFDVAGILYGKSFISHYGHLGGAFTGFTYIYWARKIWTHRATWMKWLRL